MSETDPIEELAKDIDYKVRDMMNDAVSRGEKMTGADVQAAIAGVIRDHFATMAGVNISMEHCDCRMISPGKYEQKAYCPIHGWSSEVIDTLTTALAAARAELQTLREAINKAHSLDLNNYPDQYANGYQACLEVIEANKS